MRVRRDRIEVGGVVVGQTPNPPLIVAFLAVVVSWLADAGSTLDAIASTVFYVAFTIWSWEELAHGVDWFRRLLGAGGLIIVTVSLTVTLAP